MGAQQQETYVPIVVVGGGQAGLSVGYHLAQLALPFEILDAAGETGQVWRERWDSLRLFTPARIDSLDGMRFPADHRSRPPTKDEVADYLQAYADHFRLPIRHGTRVTRLAGDGASYVLETTAGRYRADHVVVAMSSLQVPKVPDVAAGLDPTIVSIHSHDYRNPDQLPPGGVLVVGAGNSGAQIAVETARTHPTWLAGRESGAIPFRIDGFFGRHIGSRIIRQVFLHVLTTHTPVGRRARPKMLAGYDPLLRDRPRELRRAGVQRAPRVTGTAGGKPVVGEADALDVATVIWATGYRCGFEWVDVPVLEPDGTPRHERGVVAEAPGLYFVGLNFLYAKASETLPGVGRDARYVVEHIAARVAGAPADPGLVTSGAARGGTDAAAR